jgi:hypothetical protein
LAAVRRGLGVALITATAVVGAAAQAAAGDRPANARIAGQVLVCNTPDHCLTRHFQVVAIDSAGRTVARTETTTPRNHYTLAVRPGSYQLVATSHGLRCVAAATALAHHRTRQNIVCLVP